MTSRLPVRAAVISATLLTLGAEALRGQNRLDTTFAVSRGARLSVQNQSGSVEIRGWGRSQIRVQAEYEKARVEFEATSNIVSARSVNRRGNGEVAYSINVPTGTAVEINGLSVDVDISGVCGAFNVNTISGDVEAQCIDGDGQIGSVSGDVTVSDARGMLEINTTSGDIDARVARGSVTAHSVSGSVTLDEISGTEVDVETVSGDVEYAGRILDNGRYRLSAHSGDVTLRTSGTINAAMSVETFSGDFSSDFQIEIMPGTRIAHQWEFRLGTGSARVRLNSFSGTINLRRGMGSNPRER